MKSNERLERSQIDVIMKALSSDISLTASDVSALPSSTTYVSSFNGDTGAITYTAPVTSVNGQTGAVTITDSDEKLKTNLLDQSINNTAYKIVLTLGESTANTKYYDNGLDYQTRVDEHTARLSIGISGTGDNRRTGQLALYNQNKYCIIRNTSTSNSGYYINLPTSGGTLALTTDIPSVPSWALASSKPTYTASEVGAIASTAPAAAITAVDISSWNAKADSDTNTTYTISISGNTITLTPSSGTAQTITLPVYNGGVE